jgi:transglutaminase-like putative cysteine protease
MIFRVTHTTELSYETKVGLCHNLARLLPRESPQQKVLSAILQIEPLPHDHYPGTDYFGNRTDYFSIQQPHDKLVVTAVSEVDVSPAASSLFDHAAKPSWERVREQLRRERSAEALDAYQFIVDSQMVSADEMLADYARPSFSPQRPFGEAVYHLMHRIHADFKYAPEFTTIATPLREVLEHRSGVCQDFAHLAIGCLRAQGLAARYVSGYIETDPPPGRERLVGTDASHAWISVFLPGGGWLDFDPTNNQRPGERHVTVAWGRDYADVTPLKGVAFGGGDHSLQVAVDVQRIVCDLPAPGDGTKKGAG